MSQTFSVRDTLEALYTESDGPSKPKFTASFISTAGDKDKSQALYLLGGKALWTKELEVALKEKQVDLLVHCLKDVPTVLPEGCLIGAIMEREDPGYVRRAAQLKRSYPHLEFLDVRGNFSMPADGPYAALVLAKAGLVRVGFGHRITADLKPPTMLYAVSQALELCKQLTHRPTLRCLAERECLRVLEGGCSVPVGVHSELRGDVLKVTGCVTSLNGEEHIEHTIEEKVASPEDAEEVGRSLAQVLVSIGAKKILDDINTERDRRIVQAKAEDEVAAT
ncbi:porphobilinogen deaminase, partial [Coprinellus micaceus]